MSQELTVWISAKVTPGHVAKLDAIAAAARVNRSAALRLLIESAEIETVTEIRFGECCCDKEPTHD
jgi:hypothetical protein